MTILPEWLQPGPEVVHLDPRKGRTGLTPCCNLPRREIPYRDTVTMHEEKVTCELRGEYPLMNSIIDREAALSRRAGEALQRLLIVRAHIEGASPDALDSELRNELLRLIDWGNHAHRGLDLGDTGRTDGTLRRGTGHRLGDLQLRGGASGEEGEEGACTS